MKIVNERDTKYTCFCDIAIGTVFLDEDDDVLMKIREDDFKDAQAVALATGRVFDLYDEYECRVVDATLTIK